MVAPLFARARRMEETPDGYRFAFPAEAEGVRDLLEFILSERDCCPSSPLSWASRRRTSRYG